MTSGRDFFIPKSGCTRGQSRELRQSGASRKFTEQKAHASVRGIGWELTLWDWWTIWQDSGKWDERGRFAHQYAMCRKDDVGPYKISNVYIATNSENSALSARRSWRTGALTGLHLSIGKRRKRLERRLSASANAGPSHCGEAE